MIHFSFTQFLDWVTQMKKRVGVPLTFGRMVVLFLSLFTGLGWSFSVTATSESEQVLASERSFEFFQKTLSLDAQSQDLCAWEEDFGFFRSSPKGQDKSDSIDCVDRLSLGESQAQLGEMKDAFTSPDALLTEDIRSLVEGFPIEVMAQVIAQYDREIAGLIVGIGKKESNWGKRTPKQNSQECFNYWGYRGVGTKGMTADGYGCWMTPEEAVKTIGDRLVKLREVRESAEPARMIVWKCGRSCAGHSDESVRKWIADVNIYYRALAKN